MVIIKKIEEIKCIIKEWKRQGLSIGLVPTMGYLHEGHGELIKQSVANNNKTIVSVFLNPTQFGENEDLDKYPRDIERDSDLVSKLGGDIIFNPESKEMYKKESAVYINIESMANKLCGITRPTHFAGVCLVVSKLFNIITPDNAYFGLKDFQQYTIIKRMVDDLNFSVKINPVPIVRDASGLALSSRNVYLSDDEKRSALSLSKSLVYVKQLIEQGELNSANIIKEIASIILKESNIKIDYIKIVNIHTLDDIETIEDNYAILLACYVGSTRLIDNYVKI